MLRSTRNDQIARNLVELILIFMASWFLDARNSATISTFDIGQGRDKVHVRCCVIHHQPAFVYSTIMVSASRVAALCEQQWIAYVP